MADQSGHPTYPEQVSSYEGKGNRDMKSEAACQTLDNVGSNGTLGDSSLTDLFTSFSEMKMSLHKVEAQNRKLKESRSQMQSQLEITEKDTSAYKEKLHKMAEQLSFVFQENCRLNEENAHLKIKNQNLMKELESHKKKIVEQEDLLNAKHPQDYCDTCPKRKMAAGMASVVVANLEFRPELSRSMPDHLKELRSSPINSPAIKKVKGLEKRHSSPQFFPSNESVEEISEKLFAQMTQEKQELEQQYNQMVEIQRVSDAHTSGALMSDFSMLDLDCPEDEEELLKYVEKCSHHLRDVKHNVGFMNYTLKYLLYYTTIQRPQEGNNTKSIAERTEGTQQQKQQPDAKSIASTPRTLVDSLESPPDTLCANRKEGPTNLVPVRQRHLADDKIPWNSVHPPPLSPLLPNSSSTQHGFTECVILNPAVRNSDVHNPVSQEPNWRKLVPDSAYVPPSKDSSEHRRTCWPPVTPFGGDISNLQKNVSEGRSLFGSGDCTLIKRSESAEANAGSPPASLGLTPDSLLPNSQLQCDGQLLSRSPEHSSKEDDRICPMCSAVFPCPVPQDQFETHVVSHFELEEFELLNL